MNSVVKILMTVATDDPEKLNALVRKNDADCPINIDPNIGTAICSAYSYDANKRDDKEKFTMLIEILRDLVGVNEPSDEELNHNEKVIEVYSCLHNLKEAIEACGCSCDTD